MLQRVLPCFVLTTLLAAGNVAAVRADSLPAPKEDLKDFNGRGIIQVSFTPMVAASEAPDKKILAAPQVTWFPFHQAYVKPDRLLMEVGIANQAQMAMISMVNGNAETTYAPGQGLLVTRVYKNAEAAPTNPIPTLQMSMGTYARVFRDMDGGKLLPDEELDKIEKSESARIEELAKLRAELKLSKNVEDIARASAAAAESARLRDDITQIAIRRTHPCYVVEFPNKDLVQKLYSRGLAGGGDRQEGESEKDALERQFAVLNQGKTRAWITRDQGLPIKIETTSNDGQVAIFVIFTQIQINTGLRSRDISITAAPGVKPITATADVRKDGWEEMMEDDISKQIEKLTDDKKKASEPAPQPSSESSGKKKKKK